MDKIEFKVVNGTTKVKEIEELRDAIDPKLAAVYIEYLPETVNNSSKGRRIVILNQAGDNNEKD